MRQLPFRRAAFLLLAVAVPLGMTTSNLVSAYAADDTTSPTAQYLALRRLNPPRPDLTPRKLAEDPSKYRGMTLELEGDLTGMAEREDGVYLILATRDGTPPNLFLSQKPTWLQPGGRVRVLAIVTPPDETQTVFLGIPDLKVIAVASASDIAAEERRAAESAVARAAQEQRTRQALRAAEISLANGNARANGKKAASTTRRSQTSLASRGGGEPIRYSGDGSNGALVRYLSPGAQRVFPAYLNYIQKCNHRLSDSQAESITASVLLFSERYQVDPRLVIALIIAESDFKIGETSNKGAMGLGQLMPDEVHDLGLNNPYDPVQNVAGAVYLLKGRLDHYSGGGDLTMEHIILALASYNAGMGAVKKYGGVPPYRETQNYVKKIERIYRQLCGEPTS